MSFGDDVNTVLTTSLPEGHLATSVQLAYSIAVIFTFPLQNFPALEIACKHIARTMIERGWAKESSVLVDRNAISSMLVVALAIVAATTMDSLDKVVSLMGSLLGCPIAFVFPPIIHDQLCARYEDSQRRVWNRLVAFLGLVAMIFASITTIIDW